MTKELLFSVSIKDCDVQTFRAGGPGGQHQNKTETGVRVVHRESGAVGECRDSRSQLSNKKEAFNRMVKHPRFQWWITLKKRELETGKTIEERVEEDMKLSNIKTEVKVDGKWTPTVELDA